MGKYRTLKHRSTSLFKEKGSKFYSYAFPIKNADESKLKLEEVSSEHPKARHICTALLLGIGDSEYFLINDDGEPSNSAGAPILGAIRSADITNVYIAVVRYFGGVKLGVGGLISAYKTAAKGAIENNIIIEIEPMASFHIAVDYKRMGDVLSIIDKNNLSIQQSHSKDGIDFEISCKERDLNGIKALFDRFREP